MAREAAVRRDVKWLNSKEEQAWRAVASMIHKLRWALECQLARDADLSFVEYYAMARLAEEPDRRLRMSDLAFVTNASLSRLSHLVKRLESRGYMRREPDPDDGRYTFAVLTAAGYKKLVASAPGHVACVRDLLIDEFTAAEQAQLQSMCRRIIARVQASAWDQDLT